MRAFFLPFCKKMKTQKKSPLSLPPICFWFEEAPWGHGDVCHTDEQLRENLSSPLSVFERGRKSEENKWFLCLMNGCNWVYKWVFVLVFIPHCNRRKIDESKKIKFSELSICGIWSNREDMKDPSEYIRNHGNLATKRINGYLKTGKNHFEPQRVCGQTDLIPKQK